MPAETTFSFGHYLINIMSKLHYDLAYVFLIDPEKLPPHKNPTELEQMDAKRLYFYPSLTDINDKRNLVGMVEGYLIFFNSFQQEEEPELQSPQVFTLQNQVILTSNVDKTLILAVILKHRFDVQNQGMMELINLKTYQELMRLFIDLYLLFFQDFISFQQQTITQIEFVEKFTQFIESFFSVQKSQMTFDLFSLVDKESRKEQMNRQTIAKCISSKIFLKHKDPNLMGIIIYYKDQMVTHNATDQLLEMFNFLLKDEGEKSFSHFFRSHFLISDADNEKRNFIMTQKKTYFPIFIHNFTGRSKKYFSLVRSGNFTIVNFWKKNEFNNSFHYFQSDFLKGVEAKVEVRSKEINSSNQIFYNSLQKTFNLANNIDTLRQINEIFFLKYFQFFQAFKKSELTSFFDSELYYNKENMLIKCLNG